MEATKKPAIVTLRRFNHVLSVMVVIVAVYILLIPLLPQFSFWFSSHFRKNNLPPLVVANSQTSNNSVNAGETIPENDVLVIPSISLQQDILEGPNSGVLNNGVWHRPKTSTPDKGGNTVVVGHRFTYSNPSGEFYHLDKVNVGDKIVVYWQEKKYVYKVDKKFVTNADDASVENNSEEAMLTLYTCTPLWSAKDRLVVQAKLQVQTP